jgi:hypothetical protein
MACKVMRTTCGFGKQCPSIERPETGGGFEVTGRLVPAPNLPPHEGKVHIPDSLLPELADLEIDDFEAYLASVRETPGDILRIQTLARYSGEDELTRAYLAGEPAPSADELREWGEELATDAAAGRAYRNLHVIHGSLSDSLRMQFEWAYSYNVAHGMDVRIVDAGEVPAVSALRRVGDFWVLERQHVVLCRYDDDGRPHGYIRVDAGGAHGYIAAAEMGWQLGTPFKAWWDAHPEYHRQTTRAA